jgi:uroporphyrinogen decarboxylase
MTALERFLAVMEYQPLDRVPNWELGVWPQTRDRWEVEAPETLHYHWDWFAGESALGMDPKEFIRFVDGPVPRAEEETLEEDERTITFRDGLGRVRKALKEGTRQGGRMSMDTYISFPIRNMADWREMKKRYVISPCRYEPNSLPAAGWPGTRLAGWRQRQHPLIFGQNCSTLGFYWFARDMMGTEGLSYAFFDQPDLVHDIMEFHADYLIEAARPVLANATMAQTDVEYVCFNEDLAMKTGPPLSPKAYRTFILPRLRRVVEFYKRHGTRYIAIDSDGNPEALVPMMMDAGVDILWPLERAADQDPVRLRRKYGKSLRLWGGVDKRVLAEGPEAIDAHLRELAPLVAEGGYIPAVDHTVPPDVSWPNFRHYMESKAKLLGGES